MKKLALILALGLLLLMAADALAASPYEIDGQFVGNLEQILPGKLSWKRKIDRSGDFVTITETAMVNAFRCEFTVIGYTNQAYQICLSVPFKKLTMDQYAIFSNALFVYNTAYYLAMDQIPRNSEPLDIFSSYDIQTVVRNGAPYTGYSLSDGWEWVYKEPGRIAVRRSDYLHRYYIEAKIISDGSMWFDCEFH